MKSRSLIVSLVLILSALIASGCRAVAVQPTEVPTIGPTEAATVQPTEVPTTAPTEVPEAAPDEVRAARDVALAFISGRHGEQAPPQGLTWTEERTTAEGIVGSESYQYTTGDWVVTISHPVVAPEAIVYQVVVASVATGFQWEGEVNAVLQVTETVAPTGGKPVVGWLGRVVSLPEGSQFDDYLVLQPEGVGEIGLEGADNTVAAQIEILRDSDTYAHFWGMLTCPVLDYGGCQLLVTRLRDDRPGPVPDPDPVEGWEGTIISFPFGSQFPDYFALAGDFPVGYGIEGAEPALAAQLAGLRDTGRRVRVWGQVTWHTLGPYMSAISVNRIEVVGVAPTPVPAPPPTPAPTPLPEPSPTPVQSWTEPVENWWGEIVAYPLGSQYDDYFQRQIISGGQYGIESRDADIEAQIVALRDTGTTVHVWGTLLHNVPDVNATQILVTRLEVPEHPEPPEIIEEPVEGWVGTIGQLLPGSQFKDYFERDDGQRYGIEGASDTLREQVKAYQWTGARVRVWGQLLTNVPAYGGRAIQVTRIEAESGPAEQERNLTPFAKTSASSHLPTDRGGQYQSWIAIDGSVATSWVEGVAGPGMGEWLMLTFPGTIEIYYINLDVGYDRDADIFYANNRIKRATLIFSSGEQVEVTLSDKRGMQMIALARAPGPNIETTYIKVVIQEVYPGSRYDDTCLSEIEVWGRAE